MNNNAVCTKLTNYMQNIDTHNTHANTPLHFSPSYLMHTAQHWPDQIVYIVYFPFCLLIFSNFFRNEILFLLPSIQPQQQVELIPAVMIPILPQPDQGQVQVFAQPQAPAPAQSQASSFAGGMTTPNNVIDNFFIPPGQGGHPANPNGNHIVGLFNQIGNKLATTADVIAGMLRKTVDVLVSTHLHAHQPQRPIRSNWVKKAREAGEQKLTKDDG